MQKRLWASGQELRLSCSPSCSRGSQRTVPAPFRSVTERGKPGHTSQEELAIHVAADKTLTINPHTTDVCSGNNFCSVPGASQGGSAPGRSQAWTLPAAGDQCWAPRLAGQVLTLTVLWEAEPWAAQTGPGGTLARRPGWRQNCENRPSLSTAHRRPVSTALSRELTEPQPRCQPVPPVPWHVLWADPAQGRPEAASMQAEDTASSSLRWRGLLVESHALHFCGCDTGPRHRTSQIRPVQG